MWLLNGLGAPAAAVGLLVPIRESGSLIPQAAMVPLVRRFGLRKLVWVAGAIGQALAAVGIGTVALTTTLKLLFPLSVPTLHTSRRASPR